MKNVSLTRGILKVVALAVVTLMLGTKAYAGGDIFSIYLNNKLLLRQAAYEPLNVNGLQLQKAKPTDEVVVFYSQCHADNKVGKNRSLRLKDEQGNTIKEWKFADTNGPDKGMTISVKELIDLEKRSKGKLLLVYRDVQLDREQKLAAITFG